MHIQQHYMVKDINPGSPSSLIRFLVTNNNALFFDANNDASRFELWKSDGTNAGTIMVKDIFPSYISAGISVKDIYTGSNTYGTSNISAPYSLTNFNSNSFIGADDGSNGFELWKSDGSSPSGLTNINRTLYFSANDGINGLEPWKSDGSESSTLMIKNLNRGALSSEPTAFTYINGITYFTANDGNGAELFKTDGTAIGTTDFNISTPTSGGLARLNQLNGNLFFTHVIQLNGQELWILDLNSLSTSVNITNDNKFTIFPNPVNNILTIQNYKYKSIDQVTITDLSGKKVLEQISKSSTVNVEKLLNGMY